MTTAPSLAAAPVVERGARRTRTPRSAPTVLSQAGIAWLTDELALRIPAPAVRSEIVSSGRKSYPESAGTVVERFPRSYLPNGPWGHLKFALRYEPVNLGAYGAIFQAIGAPQLEAWIREEPTGRFARRAWRLYELLAGKPIDLPDVMPTGYVDLLDPAIHITGHRTQIRRQRINENLLGHGFFCPLVRRTAVLDRGAGRTAIGDLQRLAGFIRPEALLSPYSEAPCEAPSCDVSGRLRTAVQAAAEMAPFTKQNLLKLLSLLSPTSSAGAQTVQTGWRRTESGGAAPNCDDVPVMMLGWQKLATRLWEPDLTDPLVAAAVAAGSFLIVRPFQAGNQRLSGVLAEAFLRRLANVVPMPVAPLWIRCMSPDGGPAGAPIAAACRVSREIPWTFRYPDLTRWVEAFSAEVAGLLHSPLHRFEEKPTAVARMHPF